MYQHISGNERELIARVKFLIMIIYHRIERSTDLIGKEQKN